MVNTCKYKYLTAPRYSGILYKTITHTGTISNHPLMYSSLIIAYNPFTKSMVK